MPEAPSDTINARIPGRAIAGQAAPRPGTPRASSQQSLASTACCKHLERYQAREPASLRKKHAPGACWFAHGCLNLGVMASSGCAVLSIAASQAKDKARGRARTRDEHGSLRHRRRGQPCLSRRRFVSLVADERGTRRPCAIARRDSCRSHAGPNVVTTFSKEKHANGDRIHELCALQDPLTVPRYILRPKSDRKAEVLFRSPIEGAYHTIQPGE